jgi:hypothetical protein
VPAVRKGSGHGTDNSGPGPTKWRRKNIMHPTFVKLFIELDADDLLADV